MAEAQETVDNGAEYHPCHRVKVKCLDTDMMSTLKLWWLDQHQPPKGPNMSNTQTHQLQVKGMSCQHCVKAVTKAVQSQDPQATVSVDLPSGQVTVQSVLPRSTVSQAISEQGYEVQN